MSRLRYSVEIVFAMNRRDARFRCPITVRSGSGQRTDKFARVGSRTFQCLVGRRRSKRGAFDADDLDVGHAEEAEHVSEPRYLEIECSVLTGVDAATRAHDDHAIAGGHALRTGLAVAKRAAGARNL